MWAITTYMLLRGSVCVLDITVSCVKMAEPVEIMFEM